MKFNAINDKVIVKIIKDQVRETKSGLYIPENLQNLPHTMGKVISIGDEIKNVEVGDIILFHRNGGHIISFNVDEEFRVLKYDEIYCTFQSDKINSKKDDLIK